MSTPDISMRPGPAAARSREAWGLFFRDRTLLLAASFVAAGFLLRILAAALTYLSPDEVLAALAMRHPLVAGIYQDGVSNPQPVYDLFLCLWQVLGNSDFLLRLPSVLAGSAALWVFFLWARMAFGQTAALLSTMVLAFLPHASAQSATASGQAFLLLAVVAALYFQERAWQAGEVRAAVFCGLLLMFSVAVHPAGFWFAVAAGVLSSVRIIRRRPKARMTVILITGHMAAIVLGLLLYSLRASSAAASLLDESARTALFRFGEDGIVGFALSWTFAVFRLLFASVWGGVAGVVLFFAGVVLSARRARGEALPVENRERVLLLLLPFGVCAVAAMVGFFVYGASSQLAFLALFAAAGAGAFLAFPARRWFWPVIASALGLMLVANLGDTGFWGSIRNRNRSALAGAVRYIRAEVPPGALLFTDYRTQVLLQRYLPGAVGIPLDDGAGFLAAQREDYCLVSPLHTWSLTVDGFGPSIVRLSDAQRLLRGDSIWVVSIGITENLASALRTNIGVTCRDVRSFGGLVAVFHVPVVGDAMDLLAVKAAGLAGGKAMTVLWPSLYLNDSVRDRVGSLFHRLFSYEELYCDSTHRGGLTLSDCLPAMAFWVFGSLENHPQFMRHMDGKESYVSGGYRFTLLDVDTEGVAGIYLIESPVGDALDLLAPLLFARAARGANTLLWPTDYLKARVRGLEIGSDCRVLSYADYYSQLRTKETDMRPSLPILAFWVFDTDEKHPRFMRYMDGKENYVSGGYRFTLLAADPDTVAAVYLIELSEGR